MGANFGRFFVEAPGNTIFAANYNGEFDNILTNFTPAGMDDTSANVASYQVVEDTGDVGSEILPSSAEGELRRLRFSLKQLKASPEWYSSPDPAITRIARPGLCTNVADQALDLVRVLASAGVPARVRINNTIYTNVSDAAADLDVAGRNGLDTGTKAALTVYYIYAIPPLAGTTFDLVLSVTEPETGPTGFANWSYLGSMVTNGAGDIETFNAIHGNNQMATSDSGAGLQVGHSDTVGPETMLIPVTARRIYGRVEFPTPGGDSNSVSIGPEATTIALVMVTGSASAGKSNKAHLNIIIQEVQTIYMETSTASCTATFRVLGWQENLLEYQ